MPTLTAGSEGGAVRVGGLMARQARRLRPAMPVQSGLSEARKRDRGAEQQERDAQASAADESGPQIRESRGEPHPAGTQVAGPTIKRPSLYDLDFFWMTGANHGNLNDDAPPRGGRYFSVGLGERKGRRCRGVARRRAWSSNGLV